MLIVNREKCEAVNLDTAYRLNLEMENSSQYTLQAELVSSGLRIASVIARYDKIEDAIREFNRILDAYAADRRVYWIG